MQQCSPERRTEAAHGAVPNVYEAATLGKGTDVSHFLSRCILMSRLAERAGYKTHMIHKQHPAAERMSNWAFAFISRMCIITFAVILVCVVLTVPRLPFGSECTPGLKDRLLAC